MLNILPLRRSQSRLLLSVLPLTLLLAMAAPGCTQAQTTTCACLTDGDVALELPVASEHNDQLLESWQAYRDRFIQPDGRVIDRKIAIARSPKVRPTPCCGPSPSTTLTPLIAPTPGPKPTSPACDDDGQPSDRLWAWKWGQRPDGSWGTIDPNFATDADIDAATALIWPPTAGTAPSTLKKPAPCWPTFGSTGTLALPDGSRQLIPGPRGLSPRTGAD
jgi:endoglucanase